MYWLENGEDEEKKYKAYVTEEIKDTNDIKRLLDVYNEKCGAIERKLLKADTMVEYSEGEVKLEVEHE